MKLRLSGLLLAGLGFIAACIFVALVNGFLERSMDVYTQIVISLAAGVCSLIALPLGLLLWLAGSMRTARNRRSPHDG